MFLDIYIPRFFNDVSQSCTRFVYINLFWLSLQSYRRQEGYRDITCTVNNRMMLSTLPDHKYNQRNMSRPDSQHAYSNKFFFVMKTTRKYMYSFEITQMEIHIASRGMKDGTKQRNEISGKCWDWKHHRHWSRQCPWLLWPSYVITDKLSDISYSGRWENKISNISKNVHHKICCFNYVYIHVYRITKYQGWTAFNILSATGNGMYNLLVLV